MTLFKPSSLCRGSARLLAIILGLTASLYLSAQEAPKKELSDKVSDALATIGKQLGEEKNYDGAIATIDNLLAQAKPETFDTAYLSQMKVQALLYKQDYMGAIQPLEVALRLSEKYNFFDKRGELELLWLLAQLYVQDASLEKNPDIQRVKYSKALETVRSWVKQSPKPTIDAYLFAASILYSQATYTKEPDKELLKQAEAELQNALLTSIKPKDQIYQLLVAINQANNDQEKAAQYLELMVQAAPNNAQYWPMLLSSYLVMAEAAPEGSLLQADAYAKGVVTLERAQKLGFMNTPSDNFRLVGMYINSGQYEGAVDLLEAGLRTGKIAPDLKNWELLAQSYLQLHRNRKAIQVFEEAGKLFPAQGNLDMQVGNLYYNMERYPEALDAMNRALEKGVSKPGPLQFFKAYLLLELKRLDPALEAVNKSLEINPNAQDAQDLKRAILDAIEERDRNLNKAKPLTQPATTPAQTK